MNPSRRSLLRAAGATGVVSATGLPLAAHAQAPITVGVIYVGPRDDFGYNQAQAQAAAILKKMPGVKVVEEEKVPETVAVQKTMEAMINQDKASLIFATSFGYFDPHVLKVAEKYPKVRFEHCGGLWTDGKHPKNVGSFFGYIDGAQYVAGVVAGHMSKTKKLGFVAAKPIPQVLRNINAFTDLPSYRLPVAGIVSILHRVSGALMFLLMPFIIWMFDTSISSEISFARVTSVFTIGAGFVPGWFVKLVALSIIWAFLHHLIAGLRHLWMDARHAVTKEFGKSSAIFTLVLSVGLTLVLGAKLFGLY